MAGALPVTDRGNTYVMIAKKRFAKWVELIPLRNEKSGDVAHTFLD